VWWGAAFGVARLLYDAAASTSMNAHALSIDAHALAHLGAVEVALASSAALLREVATRIDAAPHARIERSALTTRAAVEAAADNIITRVGRALGPAPLCQDRAHARRVADLSVYLRQSHAEADLRRIGELLRTNDPPA
jgi:hypothetical protein